jgi:hypothetical protein
MTTRYFYLRDNKNRQPRSNGTLTRGNPVAILISEVNRTNNTISYALAVSHPKDSFMKELGRHIVNARLQDPEKSFVIHGVPTGCHQITRVIMNDLIDRAAKFGKEIVPHRVRNAAKAWLSDAASTIPAPAMGDGVEVVIPENSTVPAIRA